MAQTPNTTSLGLNQWGPEDDMRRAQFTEDNRIVNQNLMLKVATRASFPESSILNMTTYPSGKYIINNTVSGMPSTGYYWLVETFNTNEVGATQNVWIEAIRMTSGGASYRYVTMIINGVIDPWFRYGTV